jgi:PAS domain S-box-containing protein
VTRPGAGPEEVLDLLGRIHHAADLPEALSLLVEGVLAAPAERAAVLLFRGRELHGVIGVGWPADEIRRVSEDAGGTRPLGRAVHSGRPTAVRGDDAGPLGLRDYAVVPIPGAGLLPWAALVLDAPLEGEPLETAARIAAHAGPPLERQAELDRLRSAALHLDRQRELLSTILNALPDPVLITDAANNIVLENLRAEGLFNTGEGDSDGRRRAVEINNLLFSSFLTRAVIAGAGPSGRELNLVDPTEGADLLFEVLSTPLPPALAGEGAVVSVLRDITDLRRASAELEHQFKRVRQAEQKSRRERDRLNLILENVGDPILVTDEASNIILLNRQAERLFEAPPGADLRAAASRQVRANDTRFTSFISDLALSPDSHRTIEFQLVDPSSGKPFPAEVVSGKINNDRGELTAIVSVVHNLTKAAENERLASELSRLNEGLEDRIRAATEALEERNRRLEWQSRELERAYRLKSEFLASMSHELRTPINALLGYTSLMRDRIYGELTERQDGALDRMYVASQHLLELVNDILDLAKIEAGKMPIHLERVDVRDLVREIAETVEPMVRARALRFRAELHPDLPVLDTDRTKAKQVLLNLLSNAVKFTHAGEVSVHARPAAEGGVEVDVRDTGIGIPEEHLDSIFEDFRQVDQSSTREYGGTGLGLSIVKKLLGLLGGTIRVTSKTGEGSTFTIWLPARSRPLRSEEETHRMLHADSVVRTGEPEEEGDA